ncbi:hypothetical protein DFH08DRAFT_806451 [Mycena albidolilacea]|uniref:Mitochondrial splicing suppressor 51-like C-terminal domain-containing protein n=1 Tax=Mycena albidolilacea TaxID=1033008 RepID=A0AAD7A607_9AGAR|nr:hypothetical protein DFH08DRAFT_806451 [Mycena albidolilacea]
MMDSEELLHRLPKLKVLNLRHVGPEILPEVAQSYSDRTRNCACQCALCKPKGWGRFNFLSSLPYREYLAQNPLPKPDIFAGFNTGFSEVAVESWRKTVKYHKEEAILERSTLESMGGVLFVLPIEKNKWHGTIPNINIIQKFMTGKNVGFHTRITFS